MKKLLAEEMKRLEVEQFRCAKKCPLTIVLDNVRSLHNVGSVLRTADAFLIEEVIMCGITGCPPSAEIHKTALGAEDSVSWRYVKSAVDAVSELKEKGYSVYAAEQTDSSIMLQDFKMQNGERIAVVFGNEVRGVDDEVLKKCDGAIEIPQFGTKHSLNVSVSAGIVIWEIARNNLINH